MLVGLGLWAKLVQLGGSSWPRALGENRGIPQKMPPLSFSYSMSMAVSGVGLRRWVPFASGCRGRGPSSGVGSVADQKSEKLHDAQECVSICVDSLTCNFDLGNGCIACEAILRSCLLGDLLGTPGSPRDTTRAASYRAIARRGSLRRGRTLARVCLSLRLRLRLLLLLLLLLRRRLWLWMWGCSRCWLLSRLWGQGLRRHGLGGMVDKVNLVIIVTIFQRRSSARAMRCRGLSHGQRSTRSMTNRRREPSSIGPPRYSMSSSVGRVAERR